MGYDRQDRIPDDRDLDGNAGRSWQPRGDLGDLDPDALFGAFGQPLTDGPTIDWMPGMADQMLRELAPLLAEDGIDITADALDTDLATLQAALDRAVARHNHTLATPTGEQRSWCTSTLRLLAESINTSNLDLAEGVLETVPPESPDGKATVAGVIGVGAQLLDSWLTTPPAGISKTAAAKTVIRPPQWHGERAAIDLIALARKNKAHLSHGKIIATHGGHATLYGTALAVTAVLTAWANHTDTTVTNLAETHLR